MRKERINVELSLLHTNTGQLPWLPKNPRQWSKSDVEKTAKSINEDPDFLEDRPLLVVPFIDAPGQVPEVPDYVVFAGNIRREGCEQAKRSGAPCVIYYPETDDDFETVKRRAMKDNGSYGSWDWDTLANEWDDMPLPDFGVPAWNTPERETKERKSGSRTADSSDASKEFKYAVRVEFETAEEQFEFIAEMQDRGYKATSE